MQGVKINESINPNGKAGIKIDSRAIRDPIKNINKSITLANKYQE